MEARIPIKRKIKNIFLGSGFTAASRSNAIKPTRTIIIRNKYGRKRLLTK
jgi:hypothetical protein